MNAAPDEMEIACAVSGSDRPPPTTRLRRWVEWHGLSWERGGLRRPVAALVAMLTLLCSSTSASSADIVIRKTGVFSIGESGNVMTVESDANHILRFKITGRSGTLIFSSDINASSLQRWLVCVAADRSIWLYSSDIGTYVWIPDATGYQRTGVAPTSELPGKIPAALWAELPKSIQKKFPQKTDN